MAEGIGLEVVYIRPGTFTMGGTEAPAMEWQSDERPPHRVTLTRGYYLGTYEVTRGQFAAFVRATGYTTDAEREGKAWGKPVVGEFTPIWGLSWRNPGFTQGDDHPVVCVSWNDAKAFCEWATKKTGRGIRLPAEAEWEYACRAGTTTRWSVGDDQSKLSDYAWDDRNADDRPHPVGQKKPNPWGLFDMHGNVAEWCQDWAAPYSGDAVDQAGPKDGTRRATRGGAWLDSPYYASSAFRRRHDAASKSTDQGFRIVMSP